MTARAIAEAGPRLRVLHRKMFGDRSPAQSLPAPQVESAIDDLTVTAAVKRFLDYYDQNERVMRLWHNDTTNYPSASEADLALCNYLVICLGRRAALIDAVYRQSPLKRDKWDERHGAKTYAEMTLDKAITGVRETLAERQAAKAATLGFVAFRVLSNMPAPARRWLVEDWISIGTVTLLAGIGGIGKSLLVQMLAIAVANACRWLDRETRAGPVLGIFAEDDADELLRRAERMFSVYGLEPHDASKNLHLAARAGEPENLLVTFNVERVAKPTALYAELRRQCEAVRPVLVILDNVAHLFAGSENARSEVTQFCNLLNALAREFFCAVVLVGHPAKAQGSEYSGSTAWEAAVRSRLFLERNEDGTLTLRRAKSNYSALDSLMLRFEDGVLLPVAPGKAMPEHETEAIKDLLIATVRKLTQRQQSVSHLSNTKNFIVKFLVDDDLLGGWTAKTVRMVLTAMIDAGELIPNAIMPWKSASRHPVHGLALVGGAP